MDDNTSKFTVSQRLVWFIILVVGLLGGAALGTPGEAPITPDGHYFTPELLFQKLAPLGWLVTTTLFLFKSINGRVESGQMKAGDFKALLKMENFWIALVSALAAMLEIWNIHILDEAAQTLLVNFCLGAANLLLRDYAVRSAGKVESFAVIQAQQGGVWKDRAA